MTDQVLNSLMRLSAIIAMIKSDSKDFIVKGVVESFLKQHFSKAISDRFLPVFEAYYNEYKSKDHEDEKKKTTTFSVKLLKVCQLINSELHQQNKMLVLIYVLEVLKYGNSLPNREGTLTNTLGEIAKTLAEVFHIDMEEYENCKKLVENKTFLIPDKSNILILHGNKNFSFSSINNLFHQNLQGQITFLFLKSVDLYVFRYEGKQWNQINNHSIHTGKIHVFPKGGFINGPQIKPVYYNDIVREFINIPDERKIHYLAQDIEFRFPNSNNGIHKFNFEASSGQLIGVLGGSGVGKSTLINVMNGNLKLSGGQICINGYNLSLNEQNIKKIIGYVPQDDLLLEELTVYQNLYYSAKLCFKDLTEDEIHQRVDKVLLNLDLFAIKDLKVGSPLKKLISGGQRKRLNIALEIMRDPEIIFIDEPTSGLSSADSEMVMMLLKEQALKGSLIIINIHQPSSDIYKLFNRIIVMDKGGYIIYQGNPIEAIDYFKRLTHYIDNQEENSTEKGFVNPEIILKLIETHQIDAFGQYTAERKISPAEWYKYYKEQEIKTIPVQDKKYLPDSHFKTPGKLKQTRIFSLRNIRSKIADTQYLLIALLEAPLLAFILGFLTKNMNYTTDSGFQYAFIDNENLLSYLFMSVFVALFIGMTISADEIINDRKILQRERFLNLSWISYINSKIIFLLIISAIQMISFVIIGNTILEIKDMTFSFWLILFSTAVFANLIGLVISAGLKSIIAIYILIPLLLIPQLLLSGVIIKYNKLHPVFSSQKFVPVIGDLMASRWAYEALVVTQFKDNNYQKHFFEIEKELSRYTYLADYYIPELNIKLSDYAKAIENKNEKKNVNNTLILLNREIQKLLNETHSTINLQIRYLNGSEEDKYTIAEAGKILDQLKIEYRQKQDEQFSRYDKKVNKLINKLGGKENYIDLKNTHFNNNLADAVTNKQEIRGIAEFKNELIRLYEPVYYDPDSKTGRAQFYAAYKYLGKVKIETLWFNLIAIWIMNIMIYFILAFNIIDRLSGITKIVKK